MKTPIPNPKYLLQGLTLGLALIGALAASPAGASPYPAPDTRAAQLAAYRALADRVMSLGVGDGETVRGLVGGSQRVAAGLNQHIKRATLGTPFDHGKRVAVEAAVSRDAVARTLTRLSVATPKQAAHLRSDGPDRVVAVGMVDRTHAFMPAVRTAPRTPAAPIARPPSLPRPAPGAFRRYADDPPMPTITPDPAAYLQARRAAEVDALRRLAQQGGSVQVQSHSTAHGAALTTDTTHVFVTATLPGVTFGPVRPGAPGTVEVDGAARLGRAAAPVTTTGTAVVSIEDRP